MSDSIKRGGGPGSSDDVASRPDVGFHDDHVGSHLKADEAAKRRAAQGVMQRRPRRIEVEPQQVGEVLRYRGTEEDRAEKEANRRQQGLVRGKGPPRVKPQKTDVAMHAVDQDVRRIEDRVDLLMSTLARLEMRRLGDAAQLRPRPGEVDGQVLALVAEEEAAGLEEEDRNEAVTQTQHRIVAPLDGDEDRPGKKSQPEQEEEGDELELDEATAAARWDRTARDMRFLLQHLIAGGVGLALSPDPAVTFKRIFDGLTSWPQKVPPGQRPESEADYNAFLAWVFRPEYQQADFQELNEAAKGASGLGRSLG